MADTNPRLADWVYQCTNTKCQYTENWPRKRPTPPKCETYGHGRMTIVKLPGQ